MDCTAALLSYLEVILIMHLLYLIYIQLLSDDNNYGIYKVEYISLHNHLQLDPSAMESLHLFPTTTNVTFNVEGNTSNTTNLYGLLNHCKTAQGKRLLQQWIRLPLLSLEKIQNRLNNTHLFSLDTSLRTRLAVHYIYVANT
jgi:DNA mismatch repair protein MSH2